ncbi:SUMO-interacting motif-containing protein 1 isoform 2-T2 [Rhinophrynus dorsalis]
MAGSNSLGQVLILSHVVLVKENCNMACPIVISDDSDTESIPCVMGAEYSHSRRKRHARTGRYRSGSDTSTPTEYYKDVIDLTGNGSIMGSLATLDNDVIDLTGSEENPEIFHELKSESQFNNSSYPDLRLPNLERTKQTCYSYLSPTRNITNRYDEGGSVCGESGTIVNSDIASMESFSDSAVNQDGSPRGSLNDCLTSELNLKSPVESPLISFDEYLLASTFSNYQRPVFSTPSVTSQLYPGSEITSTPVPVNDAEDSTEESATPSCTLNKAWLYKLRFFKKPPVHHVYFLKGKPKEDVRQSLNIKPQLISMRSLNNVESTVEEGFPQGTLHLLNEFVSIQHYPPTSILRHVVCSILLGAEEQDLVNSAYTLLMKVQGLHPANLENVPWDWSLLTDVMEKQENPSFQLFLQYVVQTLDDDFQHHLRRRSLQHCLAKTMLSCDKSFSNVRDVIRWLIKTVTDSPEINLDPVSDSNPVDCEKQSVVCLLQRMLSIAVEVDKSPTCSSNRIAEFIFPDVISIATRHHREMLFNSIESALLRAKVLEVIFQHSCQPQPNLPLSMQKILYYMEHSTLLLGDQVESGRDGMRCFTISVYCFSVTKGL